MGARRLDVADVTWSIGETSTLVVKAVRGAGQPWGIAEEAGWAMQWLARANQPGVAAFARAIEAGNLRALHAGLRVADCRIFPGSLGPIDGLLLAVPFVARCVPSGRVWQLQTDSGDFRLWTDGCTRVPNGTTLHKTGEADLQGIQALSDTRVPDDPSAFQILNKFAARTYAPATEASRVSGAGAGLTDND